MPINHSKLYSPNSCLHPNNIKHQEGSNRSTESEWEYKSLFLCGWQQLVFIFNSYVLIGHNRHKWHLFSTLVLALIPSTPIYTHLCLVNSMWGHNSILCNLSPNSSPRPLHSGYLPCRNNKCNKQRNYPKTTACPKRSLSSSVLSVCPLNSSHVPHPFVLRRGGGGGGCEIWPSKFRERI